MGRDARPLVYAAHPMTTYGTSAEARALTRIARALPDGEIVNPATRYRDGAHWLADWPDLVPRLSALVVFGEADNAIGTGCARELCDAWFYGVPVAMLDGRGALREVSALRVYSEPVRTAARTASLVAGGATRLALAGDAG